MSRMCCRLWTGTGWWTGVAMLIIAGVAAAHGPLHEQIQQLTHELTRHPDDAARLVRRGELLLLHGLPDQARTDLERVATLRPDDVTNDFRLGQVDLDQGATNAAVQRLTRFVKARPRSLTGQRTLAQALLADGQPRSAASHFEAAIALSAEPLPDWYLEQARALQAAEAMPQEVLACLDAGIARYGPLPALQLLAIDLEMRRGETDAALARLDALAARAERKERWLARRGDVLWQAGRTHEARVAFLAAGKALDALPDKLRRAWIATELRQQLEAKLATLASSADAARPTSR